jgi:hypothetical protein
MHKGKTSMNDKTIDWLLQSEPWIEYRTRVDLLEQPETDPQVISARKAMLADPKIKALLAELTDWPGTVLNSRNRISRLYGLAQMNRSPLRFQLAEDLGWMML